MLTKDELIEIREELSHYEHKRAACIEALKIIQKHRGWISDEAIEALAPELDMSPDALDNVATFYNLIFRQPVGEHVILLCNSVSCWIMGYDRIFEHLKVRLNIDLGETTTDGKFTLLPMVCLGTCDHAPAMMIDDQLYRDLAEDKLDVILDGFRNG